MQSIIKNSLFTMMSVECVDENDYIDSNNLILCKFGDRYSPKIGLLNVNEAKRQLKGRILHIDVPEELIRLMIGKGGSNIKNITRILKEEKGLDISKIVLHPKTNEEMKISFKDIQRAIKSKEMLTHEK